MANGAFSRITSDQVRKRAVKDGIPLREAKRRLEMDLLEYKIDMASDIEDVKQILHCILERI